MADVTDAPYNGFIAHTDAQLREAVQHGLAAVAGGQRELHFVVITQFIAHPNHMFYVQFAEKLLQNLLEKVDSILKIRTAGWLS